MNELRQLREEPVTAEELRRAKDHLKGSFMLGLEITSSRMGNLARQELYFRRFFSLDEMLEQHRSRDGRGGSKTRARVFPPGPDRTRHARETRRV